jgi:hypothetical protein
MESENKLLSTLFSKIHSRRSLENEAVRLLKKSIREQGRYGSAIPVLDLPSH